MIQKYAYKIYGKFKKRPRRTYTSNRLGKSKKSFNII